MYQFPVTMSRVDGVRGNSRALESRHTAGGLGESGRLPSEKSPGLSAEFCFEFSATSNPRDGEPLSVAYRNLCYGL